MGTGLFELTTWMRFANENVRKLIAIIYIMW